MVRTAPARVHGWSQLLPQHICCGDKTPDYGCKQQGNHQGSSPEIASLATDTINTPSEIGFVLAKLLFASIFHAWRAQCIVNILDMPMRNSAFRLCAMMQASPLHKAQRQPVWSSRHLVPCTHNQSGVWASPLATSSYVPERSSSPRRATSVAVQGRIS